MKLKGRPDLLRKCSGLSTFGASHYIPIEIKNSTKCDKSEYKKQLMLYAIILEKIQGFRPPTGCFINKNKQEIPCDLSEKILQDTNEAISNILSILRGIEPPLKITKDALSTPWGEVLLRYAEQKSDISLLKLLLSKQKVQIDLLVMALLKQKNMPQKCNLKQLSPQMVKRYIKFVWNRVKKRL